MCKAIFLSLLLFSATAYARVYTCTDPQTGRVMYSNYPGCTVANVGQPAPAQAEQPVVPAQAVSQPAPVTQSRQAVSRLYRSQCRLPCSCLLPLKKLADVLWRMDGVVQGKQD